MTGQMDGWKASFCPGRPLILVNKVLANSGGQLLLLQLINNLRATCTQKLYRVVAKQAFTPLTRL